jgi:hypothetical protein
MPELHITLVFKTVPRRGADRTPHCFALIKHRELNDHPMTVFFAARQLKQSKQNGELAEQDLQDYILDWKKSWRTDDKKLAVASAIRNLILLGWLQLKISEAVPEVG